MPVPTRSNNTGPSRRGSAVWSVLLGLLSLAALPAAIVATRWSKAYELLDAAAAIPVALVLGALAVALGRRARVQGRLSLGGVRGARTARVGRALGLTGFLVGITGAMAIGVFLVLSAID